MSITRHSLLLIVLLSILLRVVAAFYLGDEVTNLPGTADQVSYHTLALRVLDGHGFTFGEPWWPVTPAGAPTAHWSYLYTAFLVGVYALFGPNALVARLIQAVIVGILHPLLAYHLAGYVAAALPGITTRTRRLLPLLAAAITAVYLYFIYYAATLMTEPFYITSLLAALLLLLTIANRLAERFDGRRAFALGLCLAAAVLLRQLFLLVIPFLFAWLAWVSRWPIVRRRALLTVGTASAVLLVAILPITAFNYSRFDSFVLLNTNAGYAFFWGNHPVYGERFAPASEMGTQYQQLVPPELRHLDEAALDRALLARSIEFVTADPPRYLRLSLSRMPAYFKFWPDPASSLVSNLSRVGSFALFLPFMLYGLLRPLLQRRQGTLRLVRPPAPLQLLYLFVVLYTVIHILTWAQIRYRLPVDAVLVLFAALALAELVTAVAQRRKLLVDGQRVAPISPTVRTRW